MSTIINPIAKPLAGTSLSTERKGHQAARVQLAMSETWPNGQPPAGITVADRNQAIWAWFAARGLGEPSDRQLRRLLPDGHVRSSLLT